MKTRLQMSRSTRQIVWVGFVAFVLRAAWVIYARNVPVDPNFASDQTGYVGDAWQVAYGHGLQNTHNPPLYPYVLGKLFVVTYRFGGSELPVRLVPGLVQALLASAVVVGIGLVAARRFSGRMGVVAALFLALAPDNIVAQGTLMTEQIFVPLFVAAFCLYFWDEEPSRTQLRWCGLVLALACLTRPVALPVAPLVVLPFFRDYPWRQATRRAAQLLVPFGLMLGAWFWHTDLTQGKVYFDTNAGRQMCIGHSEQAVNGWGDPACAEPSDEGAFAADNRLRNEGLTWIRANPDKEVGLTLRRAYMLSVQTNAAWRYYPSWDSYQLGIPQGFIQGLCRLWSLGTFVLVVTGLLLAWRRRDRLYRDCKSVAWRMALWGLGVLLVPMTVVATGRYRDPVIPILAIAVAWTLTHGRTPRCSAD